ncbi:MAG TPA: hypothetical protein VJI46_03655 [Candidatus Nanoarchaeia archaeon]|nr:hypothetical protein [Candidatus Nanoarchaeia archaeon]
MEDRNVVLATFAVRIAVAAFIFLVYSKNRNKLALYTGLFVLSLGLSALFRYLNMVTGSLFMYFLLRFFVYIGPVSLLCGIGSVGAGWVRRYKVALISGIVLSIGAFAETYIFGGPAAEATYALFPSQIIGGIILLVCAYYFLTSGARIHPLGRFLLGWGIALEGFLFLLGGFLLQKGLVSTAYYLGLIFFLMIGAGCALCTGYKK